MRLVHLILSFLLAVSSLHLPGEDGGRRILEGRLETLVADDFDRGESRRIDTLATDGGERVELHFAARPAKLKTGMRLRIEGVERDGVMEVDRVAPLSQALPEAAPLSGTTTVIAILVKYADTAAEPYTVSQVQNVIFGARGSAADFYRENSFGSHSLSGVVTQWLTARFDRPAACQYGQLSSEAEYLAQQAGYDPSSYQKHVYVFPRLPGCGWAGLAGGNSAWINQALNVHLAGHALGHCFGLGHAGALDCGAGGRCTVSEYGDPYEIMGNRRAMHFNAQHKSELGYLPAGSVVTHSSGSATYLISSIESPGGSTYAVEVPGSGATYWVEHREAIGFDSGLGTRTQMSNGARLHVSRRGEPYCPSCALDMTPAIGGSIDGALTVGSTFTDASSGVTISTTGKIGDAIQVHVSLAPPPTATPAPSQTNPPTPARVPTRTPIPSPVGRSFGLVSPAGAAAANGFSLLHAFSPSPQSPYAALVSDGAGNLYGTTHDGGIFSLGAVFTLKTDGTGFTVLHSFASSEGAAPFAGLVLDSSGYLYGTTYKQGSSNLGSVFKLKTDGTGFTVLHTFAGGASDGQNPYAALVLDTSGVLYGTTTGGGSSNLGTVFKLKTDGTGFTLLRTFAGGAADGQSPYASLILDGSGVLYGTTRRGGASDKGTAFKLKTDGTGFTILHSFAVGASDGQFPQTSLILDSSGNLYGTTLNGGSTSLGLGTVFKLKTDGTGFLLLHAFSGTSDGSNPYLSSVVLDGSGNLYGTTFFGGPTGYGTVFKLKTDGTSFATLHSFAGGAADGFLPVATPILDGSGVLYGTTTSGGLANQGTVFKIKTDATGFALLHTFTRPDGEGPRASLILDGSANLYGTTFSGGAFNLGGAFKLKTDGTGFSVLHSFGGSGDGTHPYAPLILDGSGYLYGTTFDGGSSNLGTVFRMKTDGTGFAVLHNFTGGAADGLYPYSSLLLDVAGVLYGTTFGGGTSNRGTVFKLKTDGTGFALLRAFVGGAADGKNPAASLILDGSGVLYGTTRFGGTSDNGTLFKLKTDATGFALLHSFAGGSSDGQYPQAALILDAAGNLYGTTVNGGSSGMGTVFRVKTDGTGFVLLHAFSGASDGSNPYYASLALDGAGILYGTAVFGGSSAQGTVFKLKTSGAGFALLHTFVGGASDGSFPFAGLILDGAGNLYGTTISGGVAKTGTVFTLPSSTTPLPTATPTRTSAPPTSTFTPTRTATATRTSTRSATATRTPTATRTSTPAASATRTPTPTRTFTPSRTPTRTSTPLVSPTPSRTPTRTATSAPTKTKTPTPMVTATHRPRQTHTPTATRTP